jgi:hypothetical protein
VKGILRQAHAVAAIVFVAAILVQVFLAGTSIANLGGSGDFKTHIEFGYTWVGLASLAVLLTAVAAGLPRRDIAITFGMLLLYVVQTLLPAAKDSAPWVAALHPVNAMLLFAIAAWYARRAWRTRTATTEAKATIPSADAS